MRVVDRPAQDYIGQGGVSVVEGKLAGYVQAHAMAVVEHLQQVAPVRVVEHGKPPIVNHEHVYPGQLLK